MENRKILHVKQEKRKQNAVLLIMRRLITGPAYPRDLQKELDLSRSAVYYHLGRLVRYKLAKQLKDNRYAFISYIDGEEAVIQTIRKWKKIASRDPTPIEIASEAGISTNDAEVLARKTKDKTDWSMPNQAILESAAEKLGEILVCAARIKDDTIENFNYEQDSEIVEEANLYLKEHPEMLPKLDEDGTVIISWPPAALKYLGKIHKPKDRPKVFLAA